jgi:plastocyanin
MTALPKGLVVLRRYLVVFAVLLATASLAYAAAHRVVGQKGALFSPGKMNVSVGDVVVFKNDDGVTHHIYSSTKGQEFNLETTAPGQDVRHTFAKAGRVDIRCGLHPGMRLVVTVN